MKVGQYDIKLDDVGFMIVEGTYSDTGRTPLLEKNIMETAEGSLDFNIGWPYYQRSWILGEQQEYTHEYDELKTTAPRRYYEGHGVNNEDHGKLRLLPALTQSLSRATLQGLHAQANFSSCPMCTNKTGSTVYAFPYISAYMWKFNNGGWTAEFMDPDGGSVVGPVIDCINAGDDLYIIDGGFVGDTNVIKRDSSGNWTRVTPSTGTTTFGYDEIATDTVDIVMDTKYVTKWTCPYNGAVPKLTAYIDGNGSGSGTQTIKGIIYSSSSTAPNELVSNATSAAVVVSDGQAASWIDFTFSTAPTVSGVDYWLGIIADSNSGSARLYYLSTGAGLSATTSDDYTDGPSSTFGTPTLNTNWYCIYASLTYVIAGWSSTAYNNATALAWSNGELFILTPSAMYCHTMNEYGSEWTGGSIMCSHSGCIFFSDGSNRVYMYQGQGTRLILEDLPDGYQVQSLFSKQARLWICGQLANGDAAIYWYSRQMWGVVGKWPKGTSNRSVNAGTATTEHVIFADNRYGGTTRHYVSEGGISHYLASGSEKTVPYKGLTYGGGHICVVLYDDSTEDGIYIDSTSTYVTSGYVIGSNTDLQMPGHKKLWHSVTVNTLPMSAGDRIEVYVSTDNGITFVHYGDMEGVGLTQGEFRLETIGVIAQYKLIMYAGTAAATTPTVISVALRGSPLVNYGRKWEFGIKGYLDVENMTGRSDSGMKEKIDRLLTKIDNATPMTFEDIYGDQYRVVARPFKRQPFRKSLEDPRTIGCVVAVSLEETP